MYIAANVYFHESKMFKYLDEADYGFGVARSFGMSISAGLLSATIWKLKSAKVSKADSDSGHLKIIDASILLGMQVTMIMTGAISLFYFDTQT